MRELCVCLFKAEGMFNSYGLTVSTQNKVMHAPNQNSYHVMGGRLKVW